MTHFSSEINSLRTWLAGLLLLLGMAMRPLQVAAQVPTVTSVAPTSAFPGTQVTITGTGFTTTTGVTFNGVLTTSLTVVSATSLTAYVPVLATTGPVKVTNTSGTNASVVNLTVTPNAPDVVVNVTPAGTQDACTSPLLTASAIIRPFIPTGSGLGAVLGNSVRALALQPDGKVFVGGEFTTYNGTTRNRIARLNPSGTLDAAFAPAGAGLNGTVYALALQVDGKILVGGAFTAYDGTTRNNVARLNADGSLDGTFAPTGTGLNGIVYAMALQPDGKILVGGDFLQYNGAARARLARLNANGTLDATFDATGVGANNTVRAIALQADGKVLIGGNFTNVVGTARNYVARLSTTGTIDATFAPTGAGLNGIVRTIALQTDGKVIVGGDFTSYDVTTRNYVARLAATGALDGTFAPTGTGLNGIVHSLALQTDGMLLVGGDFTTFNGSARTRIARLTAAGALNSFAPIGSGLNNSVYAIAYQPNTKVLIGGAFTLYNGVTRNYVTRLNNNATNDASNAAAAGATYVWSPGGSTASTVTPSAAGGNFQATATVSGFNFLSNTVVVTPCGPPNITSFTPTSGIAGTVVTITGTNLGGTTALSFNGTAAASFTNNSATQVTATVPVGATTGPISLTTGTGTATSGTNFTVIPPPTVTSFSPTSGVLGTQVTITGTAFNNATGVTFNGVLTNGLTVVNSTTITAYVPVGATTGPISVTTPVGTGTSATNFTVTPNAPDGVVTVSPAGPVSACSNPTLTAVAGIKPFVPTGTGLNGDVYAVALQPNGKVVVGGNFTAFNGFTTNRIIRLNTDGSRDVTFAPTGTGLNGNVNAVVVQPDGKIIVGGTFTSYNGTTANYLARLNANGSLDGTFAPVGAGLDGFVYALALQPDGKVLIGGLFTNYDGGARGNIARIYDDGTLDDSFAASGAGTEDVVYALAVQPDGKVLVGGNFLTFDNLSGAPFLVRLNPDGTRDAGIANFATNLNGQVNAIVVQPDGKLLVGGLMSSPIVRLNTNGTPDGSFTPTGSGLNGGVQAVALQPDGKVLVGGMFTTYNGSPVNRVARLNSDGTRDAGFGPVGTGLNNTVNALALQPDSKVIVGGIFTAYNVTTRNRIARLQPDGALDATATPSPGATYVWSPGGSTASTVMPGLAGGNYVVTATIGGVNFVSNTVMVISCAPTITSFTSTSGPEGTVVSVTGTNLSYVTNVAFNGTAASNVTINSNTNLTATVAVGSTTGLVSVSSPGGTGSSSSPFTVLAIYNATLNQCLSTNTITSTGSGQWQYLLAGNGQLVLALNDGGRVLGQVSAQFMQVPASPVRTTSQGAEQLSRNWRIVAANTFFGQAVTVRFYALNSEFASLVAANDGDGNDVSGLSSLRVTQYSAPIEDCQLNNNLTGPPAEIRSLMPIDATTLNGANWFVVETAIADHFSEFYLNGGNATLPVELVSFEAQRLGTGTVATTWRTASEKDNHGFIVQRSLNLRDYVAVSGLLAGAGTSMEPHAYTWTDATAPKTVAYYRLLQLDTDGTAHYSTVVTVGSATGTAPPLVLHPNPAHDQVTLTNLPASQPVLLLDPMGRVVRTLPASEATTLNVSLTGLPAGVYGVRCGGTTARLVVE